MLELCRGYVEISPAKKDNCLETGIMDFEFPPEDLGAVIGQPAVFEKTREKLRHVCGE